MLRAAVAAGHPATTAAGVEILEAGGSAADAAVAACLASCVAETVMTGLLGGGHAIYWDAASGRARLLDCFCAVPSGHGGELLELQVPFGEELVHYAVGAASCAVPGVPAGLDALWREHGRLPWADLCAPALRLAHDGVAMPPAHVACLEMLEPVMTMREGARIYAPEGRLLRPGELLEEPGLVPALEAIAEEGAASIYTGSIAESLLALIDQRGGVVTRADLAGYEASWPSRPRSPTRARASSPAGACPASWGRWPRCRRSAKNRSARCSCSTRSTPSADRRHTRPTSSRQTPREMYAC
jgi:gamma-glutamyltranspeptidase/glutathione hydrolase